MESETQAEPDYAEPQRQVQRRLGRCMLSLQQSERALRALLHEADVTAVHSGREGEGAAAFEVRRAFEKGRLASMTLGGLVSAFFGDVAVEVSAPSERQRKSDGHDSRLSIGWSFKLPLDQSRLDAMQSSMREMVTLRNEWVHHLVDRFDLQSVEGCARALEGLQAGYEKAERFRLELMGIVKAMVDARKHMAAFHASVEGQQILRTGKMPLEGSAILNALRNAVHASTPLDDGTVLLRDVLERLPLLHPDERPESYGYASWPQVIHESRVFGMVRRDADGRKVPPRVRANAVPNRSEDGRSTS